jgi:hypothetical protein
LILAVCSEIEVVAKQLCEVHAPNWPPPNKDGKPIERLNMDHLRAGLAAAFPNLYTIEVRLDRFDLRFKPWESWGLGRNPTWWSDHQQVKHERHNSFAKVHFEHCLAAGAGLFALECYLHCTELESTLPVMPTLYSLPGGPGIVIDGYWELPDPITGNEDRVAKHRGRIRDER